MNTCKKNIETPKNHIKHQSKTTTQLIPTQVKANNKTLNIYRNHHKTHNTQNK